MATTVLGIFDDPTEARRALEQIRASSLPTDDVSIISRATETGNAVSDEDHISAGEGAAIGAVWGGLVGLGALLIPGIGPFIAGGALAAALTGAATGAVVGGVAGALVDNIGMSEAEAREYEALIDAGKTLIAVRTDDSHVDEARRMLVDVGADEVHDGASDREEISAAAQAPTTTAYGEPLDTYQVPSADGLGAPLQSEPNALNSMAMPTPIPASDNVPVTETTTGEVPVQPTRSSRRNVRVAMYADGKRVSRPGDDEWTRGEVVGEGQGSGPRDDTGTYDSTQWVGEGQGPAKPSEHAWTSGEVIGEGQGNGPRDDTGTYTSQQWVGEGQGAPAPDPDKKKTE